MARVFIGDYCVDYSIVDGNIRGFSKKNERGKWESVTENYEEELIAVGNRVMEAQAKDKNIRGYSAFIYKLAEEGKLNTAVMVIDNGANNNKM